MYLGYDSITVWYLQQQRQRRAPFGGAERKFGYFFGRVGVSVVLGGGNGGVVGISMVNSDGREWEPEWVNWKYYGVFGKQMWLIYMVHYTSIYVISYL